MFVFICIYLSILELDQLSQEYQQKVQALNETSLHESELKTEVLNLQKNLQLLQQHFTESETMVHTNNIMHYALLHATLQLSTTSAKNAELQDKLLTKESHCKQLSSEVAALSSELKSSQTTCKAQQASLSDSQSELDLSKKEVDILSVEKRELQTRLESVLSDLNSAHKKLEIGGKEKSEHVHVMAIKDQQMLEMESEKSKLVDELRESKTIAQSTQENLQKIVDEKNAEIFKIKQDSLTTGAELTVAEKRIEILDKELHKLRSQMEESSSSFLKDKTTLSAELSSTTEELTQIKSKLAKKDEALNSKELEVINFNEQNKQLSLELNQIKVDLAKANSTCDRLQTQIVTLTEEVDIKTR